MMRELLRQQWKTSASAVLVLSLVAFAVPLLTVFYGGGLTEADASDVAGWLAAAVSIGRAFPVLALFSGVLLAMAAWGPDHLGGHVYARSLPLTRSGFVLRRFVAGAALVLVPVVAMGIGCATATAAIVLPEGLHSYALALTLRFGLASLTCFALIFALSSVTRQVALVLLGFIGAIAVSDILLAGFGAEQRVSQMAVTVLTTWPGPLAILMGRWALFDV